MAASLSFTTLLSLVPLMVVSFSLLHLFPAFQHVELELRRIIFTHFVPTSGQEIQAYLRIWQQQAQKLTGLGAGCLLLSAVWLVGNIDEAFHILQDAPCRRPWRQKWVLYWAVLTLTPLMLACALAVIAVVLRHLTHCCGTFLWLPRAFFFALLPWLASFFVFSFLYLVIPYCKVKWQQALIGALLASCLFAGARWAFVAYLQLFTGYTVIYGTLAALPIFLLWLYLSWFIVLMGFALVCCLNDHVPLLSSPI